MAKLKEHFIKNGNARKTACGQKLDGRIWTTRLDRVSCTSCLRSHEYGEARTPYRNVAP